MEYDTKWLNTNIYYTSEGDSDHIYYLDQTRKGEINMLDTISMAKMLQGEYREAFEKVDLYSSLGGVNPDTVDNKLMDLYNK